ncbi:MAG TPA: YkgJ family cysteine cluster protein, partial [Candidatus Thermoplasmatota archaeon]|nr:YkgJ family cysteine cluster protein [Candidatus Thermoplasmatota archaeon]
ARVRRALAALDEAKGRLVVFAWENDVQECHFVNGENRCTIYEDRPVACRAYPLRFRKGAPDPSPLCHATFTPPDGDYARAYPDVLPWAEQAKALVRSTQSRLIALQERGVLTPAVGASRAWVARLLAEGAVVDVLDLESA